MRTKRLALISWTLILAGMAYGPSQQAGAIGAGLSKKKSFITTKGRALWILALLSPVIAELLSGSSPPLEFFNPVSFAFLLGLYGAGVLIVREAVVIWDKGWASVIMLGAAYGILEEGVAVKSFFDPEWMDLGDLGVYGRFMHTNWVWAVWLTIYHSAVSISLPILIVSMLYPSLRKERLLTPARLLAVFVILFLDVVACATILNDYGPDLLMYVLAILSVFGLLFIARAIPKDFLRANHLTPTQSPATFFVVGLFFLLGSFVTSAIFASSSIPPIVPIALMLALSTAVLLVLIRTMGATDNKAQKGFFVAGMLSFFVLLGIIVEFNGMLGMSVVAAATVLFITDFTRWSRGRRLLMFHRFRGLLYGG